MSEPEQGVGAILRAAREAQGLSVGEAAQQLRLMNRQVSAMEDEEFASLGQPVFARGFVRNYARMLGLDTAKILQLMGGAQVEPVEVTQTSPLVLPGRWFTSRWLITGMLLLLLGTVLPIGLYAWLSSDTEAVTAPVTRHQPATPVMPPVAENNAAGVVVAVPADGNATSGVMMSVAENSAPAATNAMITLPPIKREMRFEFADDAWLDVKDSTGQNLHREMNLKGSSLVLTGQPPLALVIGNAAQVRMSYNGRPLDLTPYINANVARFSLEE